MPSTSLGYRHGCESLGSHTKRVRALSDTTAPASASPASTPRTLGVRVPKGLIPVVLYSLLFTAVPIVNYYVAPDYNDTTVKGIVCMYSALCALAIVLANDCVAWFNIVLATHLAIEIVVLNKLHDFAQLATTSDQSMALAYVSFGVIIFHLIPFFLVNNVHVLTLLGFVGIILNTVSLTYVASDMLLVTGISSSALLILTLLVASIDCVSTSLFSALRSALKDSLYLVCVKYEV